MEMVVMTPARKAHKNTIASGKANRNVKRESWQKEVQNSILQADAGSENNEHTNTAKSIDEKTKPAPTAIHTTANDGRQRQLQNIQSGDKTHSRVRLHHLF